MSSEAVEELATVIATMVRGGQSADSAVAQLSKYAPADVLKQARVEFEKAVGVIQKMDDPGALVSDVIRKEGWYAGPGAGDFFWPQLDAQLRGSLGDAPLAGIDASSSKVLSSMNAPGLPKFSGRGLVLGYVQSGKTTNFISVIAKAADAGYRVFIVLSGITENLRSQTQARVDRSLVELGDDHWFRLTDMDSDFHQTKENAAALLKQEGLRFIAVVKKNPARLRRLRDWLTAAGPIQLANNPILLIDDEADQASIDVGARGRASRINGLMKEILRKPKAAYVAYTATPFANLLINAADENDFYPRDFIVPLPRPTGYFGAEELFGLPERSRPEDADDDGLNVIREIADDESSVMRPPAGKGAVLDWEPTVTGALADALEWFVLATAARRLRGSGNAHSTMLVHTSMLAEAHVRMAAAITHYVGVLGKALANQDPVVLDRLESLWNAEVETVPADQFDNPDHHFDELRPLLSVVLSESKIVVDNYLSPDRLSYVDDQPATTIVVGGNTLSRGLTLEGLVSSYFVRSASAYDTLLQMGRWFGFRGGYEDLVRIWMTDELRRWFMDLSLVEAEIRQEINRYEIEALTPAEVAVRIRSHPSLAITSAAKMKHAVKAQMSYSEQRPQTILFETSDAAWLRANIDALTGMVEAVSPYHPEVTFAGGRKGFRGVSAGDVIDFLRAYTFHSNAQSVRSDLLVKYIENEVAADSLMHWNIVLMGQPSEDDRGLDVGMSLKLGLLQRSKLKNDTVSWANVKSIVSTSDRAADLDLTPSEISAELARKGQKLTDASLLALRDDILGPTGLLCIYPIDKDSKPKANTTELRVPLEAEDDVIALALFFPKARGEHSEVEYMIADLSAQVFESEEEEKEQIELADTLDDSVLASEDTPK